MATEFGPGRPANEFNLAKMATEFGPGRATNEFNLGKMSTMTSEFALARMLATMTQHKQQFFSALYRDGETTATSGTSDHFHGQANDGKFFKGCVLLFYCGLRVLHFIIEFHFKEK